MYIKSTIYPYRSIEKSKVHPNQPFLKPICYYIRIEERKRERKGRKKGKNGHIIILLLPKNQQKNQTIENCKRSPNYRNSKNRDDIAIFEFQKYGLFSHRSRFMEFHLYSILIQFSYFVNSKNRHYFQNFRFVYFQEYFLFLKWTDFWNSNSMVYLVSIPISGIPKI